MTSSLSWLISVDWRRQVCCRVSMSIADDLVMPPAVLLDEEVRVDKLCRREGVMLQILDPCAASFEAEGRALVSVLVVSKD